MAATKKKKPVTKEQLISAYMHQTLERDAYPSNEYSFCRVAEIPEEDFYTHFGSLETLKEAVWVAFLDQTLSLLEKDKGYQDYGTRERMLAFYYTFFEILTLNRSYALFVVRNGQKDLSEMRQLRGLRRGLRQYAETLPQEEADGQGKLSQARRQIFSEGVWVHWLFLLRFWSRDTSPAQEKTDMAIEKSVNTLFDLLDFSPIESVVDLGKFLVKERFA
ncbi:DNA-binding transcriptional regulator, AcrR family [Robiginitalea myxolifaciens]|uniref:DNA-binding transcriptional regulator, AcrR family n=1 Tax=Robiginitalea myxolifaciens TaxID=400055 RepID=A0A1I6FNN5_9FLAO|nr:TetR family transcriptional regulator C-terminal domain-containing protein [Robiginitalea myxolifaciens]SFR31561.1 DNA-binding transcriptional regulator, AcrR family [Robiginitalea myxolifaciens]